MSEGPGFPLGVPDGVSPYINGGVLVKVSRLLGGLAFVACWLAPLGAAQAQSTTYDSLAFTALKWRELGPFIGGRSVAVGGSDARPREYYIGTTGGGADVIFARSSVGAPHSHRAAADEGAKLAPLESSKRETVVCRGLRLSCAQGREPTGDEREPTQ